MLLKRANVEVVETDTEKIAELKAAGFEIISGPAEVPASEAKALADMTVKEIRAIAKERGLTLSSALKKDDLVEILEAGDDGNTEAEAAPEA